MTSSPDPNADLAYTRPGRSLRSWVARIERADRLDGPARGLRAATAALLRNDTMADALRGTWLGHALHPLLTDLPLGAWLSASLIDLFGGPAARREARGLVGFGLALSVPTAAAGLADWHRASEAARRVGIVHAALNTAVVSLYAGSYLARRRGDQRRGVALALGGGVLANASGYLGGHLSLVLGTGVGRDSGAGGREHPPSRGVASGPQEGHAAR